MNALQIAGYDRRTDMLAIQHALPADKAIDVRRLANMGAGDEGYGCYPIDADAVQTIGHWLGWPLPVDLYDWFIEPAER